MNYRIALDGPSGAGKSTVAKAMAKRLGIVYVDTGAMYRTIGLFVRRKEVSPDDAEAVAALLPEIKLEICFQNGEQHILLCGEDVGDKIRTPEMSMYASKVSAIGAVRSFLLDTQRNLAKSNPVVMDGRDIGTVIFPDAEVKIFLTASLEARAKRRHLELEAKGIETTYEDVLKDMTERDKNDSTRAIAPAIAAPDAVHLDSSDLTLEETVARAIEIAEEKIGQTPKKTGIQKKKKTRRINFYTVLRFLLGGLLRFLWRVKVHGKENVPSEGACVVCANHIAIKDTFILVISFPRQIRFLGKAELFRIPVLRGILKLCGVTPIDRGGSDVGGLKRMIRLAEEGELVGVFPQGTRCPGVNPADTKPKNGAALIACRSGADMLPVCIKTKGERYRFLRRKDVYIGQVIPNKELFPTGDRAECSATTDRVFSQICALGGYVKTPALSEEGKQ